ncbi:K+/H+ antiporter subunit F [Marinimicrobium sp. ABcell2]|uniref:K+/H+ antiporter subunit F n=1 Tax=Marinimicrobium sp. ABcell2 TaxID=3069751 RepID=UPI0027B5FDE6|nr:K+/H+ antiporter subunit F [Marinimicrobium sp. ABcell2]MDQ2075364.1 K+/H+ antiporter subunit F [Marinimicrobium sp. ABcell2]
MLEIVVPLSLVIYALSALLTILRMALGPDIPDRILTLDALYVNAIALIILFGVYLGSTAFFEAALLIAMMGFVGTTAVCKYLLRGNIIE